MCSFQQNHCHVEKLQAKGNCHLICSLSLSLSLWWYLPISSSFLGESGNPPAASYLWLQMNALTALMKFIQMSFHMSELMQRKVHQIPLGSRNARPAGQPTCAPVSCDLLRSGGHRRAVCAGGRSPSCGRWALRDWWPGRTPLSRWRSSWRRCWEPTWGWWRNMDWNQSTNECLAA